MSRTIKLDIPETAEERVKRELDRKLMSRNLAMELAEPIQEAAARLFEMYLREAVAPLQSRIRELEEDVERKASWIKRGDADLERYEKDIVALTDRAVAAEEFARECRRQVFALCDDTEERCAATAEGDTEGKQGAFARGRIHEAKGIRRAFWEWFRAATEAKP